MSATDGNNIPAPSPATSEDDDPGALFASAGNGGGGEVVNEGDQDKKALEAWRRQRGEEPGEEGDAAAAAAAYASVAGSVPAPAPEAMFATAGGDRGGGETTDEIIEEVVDEEFIEEEIIDESADDQTYGDGDTMTAGSQPSAEISVAETETTRDFPESPPIDENDSWVPKKPGENRGDVLVDEEENEIMDEVIEEDVVVDELGNEIIEEEEAVSVDERGNEIIEEIAETIEEDEEEKLEDDEEEIGARDLSPDLEIEEPLDLEAQAQRDLLHKTKPQDMSFMSKFLLCFVFSAMVIAGLLIALLVFDVDGVDEAAATASPTAATIPLGPTNNGIVDVAETTPLAAVTGNCNYGALEQPHVIDQCTCGPTISQIAPDIVARYETLVPWIQTIFEDWNESVNSCSPRNQALVWLSSGTNSGGEITRTRRKDRYLSGLLYIQQEGTGWSKKENWLSEENICKWEGVYCDDNEGVIGVDVQENNLKGQLSEGVGMYDFLEFISVRRNQLNGTIPQELFASKTLKSIDLYKNSFFGEIPSFDNDIPLETLHVGMNRLSGRIYESIANAKSLKRLDLSFNTLNGAIPKVLFNLALRQLNLNANLLTGTIHTELGTVTSLIELNIGGNPFTGSLPVQIGSLTNLEEFVVRDAPHLQGRIPASFGLALRNLLKVVVSGTSIEGNIPETFGKVSGLEHMDFSNNRLRGDLSSEFGNLRNLKFMNLVYNDIAGSIPTHFGQLTNLQALLLENNELTGDIPTELSNLSNLKQLTLQDNKMEGRAPDEVCALRGTGMNIFIVDCPVRVGDDIIGLICDTPECCTSCKELES